MTTPAARSGTRHPGRQLARPLPRQLSRLLVLMLLTLAAGVGLAGPAAAHNVLTSSDPTDGSTLQTAPTTVRLTFDQPVQDFEPVVTVIGPDGNRYESGAPVVDSTVVTAGVNALPVAGAYSIAYRIVSADGHPVEGEIKFELAEGAVGGAARASDRIGSGRLGRCVCGFGDCGFDGCGTDAAASTSRHRRSVRPSPRRLRPARRWPRCRRGRRRGCPDGSGPRSRWPGSWSPRRSS